MNLREKILGLWARWSTARPGKALLIVLAITLFLGSGMARLRMDMTFYSILPDKSDQVRDLKRIVENFSYASGIAVVVDGRKIEDPEKAETAVKRTIDALVAEYAGDRYGPYVSAVTGKLDLTFFKEHGLMLSKMKDLTRLARSYGDLNLVPLLRHINDDFEAEYSGNSKNLKKDEAEAVTRFRGLGKLLSLIEDAARGKTVDDGPLGEALDSYMLGEDYLMSKDNRMGILIVQPAFTINDISILRPGVDAIEAGAKKVAAREGLTAGLTGMTTVARDEMATSEQGLLWSSLLSFLLIIGLLILVFRMFSVPLIAGVPLITGILWTVGLSGFFLDRLNIMTAMYIVALMGLGIDFAIHLLSGYIQENDAGADFGTAIENSLVKSGAGILTGGLTTAAAFFTLTIAKTSIMRELGVVAGMGILSELVVMVLMVPPILALRGKRALRKGRREKKIFSKIRIRSDAASPIGRLIVKAPLLLAAVMMAIIAVFTLKAGDVSLQKNMLEMEAKGLESVHLNAVMIEEFGLAPDGLFIVSSDLDEVRSLTGKLKGLSSVKSVDSLSDYYVSAADFKERGDYIRRFLSRLDTVEPLGKVDTEALSDELKRLEANLREMGDMAFLGNMDRLVNALGRITGINKEGVKTGETSFDRLFALLEKGPDGKSGSSLQKFQNSLFTDLMGRVRKMAGLEKVTPEMLPTGIRDSLVSKDGKSYLLSINPTQNPWEGDFRNIFTTQIRSVTDKATGMILAGDQLTIMAEVDGVRAAVLALIAVFLIILSDFRNIKLAVLTMLPLIGAFLTLFGFMGFTGIKFDFLNIIVVPLLIGIGIDNAVHIDHRYLKEGPGTMELVMARTGTALLLTTLTTIFGFASFIPSVMRAMRSTGIVLSLAMTIAFLYSVLLHPAMLILVNEKLGWNIHSWGRRK